VQGVYRSSVCVLCRQSSEPELSLWKTNLCNFDEVDEQPADSVIGSVPVSAHTRNADNSPLQVTVAPYPGDRTGTEEIGATEASPGSATIGEPSVETGRSSSTRPAETNRPSSTRSVDVGSTSLPVKLSEVDLGPSTGTTELPGPDKSTTAASPLESPQHSQQSPPKTVDLDTLPSPSIPGTVLPCDSLAKTLPGTLPVMSVPGTVLPSDVSQSKVSSSSAALKAGIVTSVASTVAGPLQADDNFSLASQPATDLLPPENILTSASEPQMVRCNNVYEFVNFYWPIC